MMQGEDSDGYVDFFKERDSSSEYYSFFRHEQPSSPKLLTPANNRNIIKYLNEVLPSINDQESVYAAGLILDLLRLRDKWVMNYPIQNSPSIKIKSTIEQDSSYEPIYDPLSIPIPDYLPGIINYEKGIFWFTETTNVPTIKISKPNVLSSDEFINDLSSIMSVVQNSAANTFAYDRLQLLEYKFKLHKSFSGQDEVQELKSIKHRDFYNVRKIDTHIHHSGSMTQKHLLRFIRDKYISEPDTVIIKKDDNDITLKQLFDETLKITPHELSLDSLAINDQADCFRRFDRFNLKYNPFGQHELRTAFLKVDNCINGRYLAEITQQMIEKLESSKYEHVEWRISIYGSSENEWQNLASWISNNNLHSIRVRWVIQIPRLYAIFKAKKNINSFGEMLRNIFKPLFEAVQDPKKHPEIYLFLHQIVAWDCVDDESITFNYHLSKSNLPKPDEWTSENTPPYSYFHYYIYANAKTLNELLIKQNIAPKLFRPHCGEAGNISHLASMFLLANSINHGLKLRKSPILLYLYYLKQIGLAVSPLSNNLIFLDLAKQPFYRYHCIGLNISLSTDDPLMFHLTGHSLLEEYSVFASVFRLNAVDLCEIARNSILQRYRACLPSGFEHQLKKHWLGPKYWKNDIEANSPQHTNTSNIRFGYRLDNLLAEMRVLTYLAGARHFGKI